MQDYSRFGLGVVGAFGIGDPGSAEPLRTVAALVPTPR
jgi:hypothetical protein